jgi:hypothetical protein
MNEIDYQVLTLRLDPILHANLKAFCALKHMSMASLVTQLINTHLEKHGKQ